eukprot:CAMPEP_0171667484 /NCGR_PEP_ID=MMETSP0990-20121206/48738_1 /TAXON_ID=483369 /ORGANISM="non described non described, Strain CCMP2098" /LENGTH=31 /DNA_ID= /DNA_START= /DNA_END= /DNA_ORIENTATION=
MKKRATEDQDRRRGPGSRSVSLEGENIVYCA